MSIVKSFIEKLNALKEKNSAERAKKKVSLPDATKMKREGDKTALDFYMEALYNMSPKDIQSLSTRQWVTMFAVIDKLRKGDGIYDKLMDNLDKQADILLERERIAEDEEIKASINEYEKIKASINNKQTKLGNRRKVLQAYFAEHGRGEMLFEELKDFYPETIIHLYSNYRFSNKIKEYLDEMGRAIGQMLANESETMASPIALNIGNARVNLGNEISEDMLDVLYKGAVEIGVEPTPIVIDKNLKACFNIGKNMKVNGISQLDKIGLNDEVDARALRTIIHECLHGYAQSRDLYSEVMRQEECYPFVGATEGTEIKDFMYLMHLNEKVYVCPSIDCQILDDLQLDAYKNQPIERHSGYVSAVAMREYRKLTRYQCPNNAVDVVNYLKQLIGMPFDISENLDEKTIKLAYINSENTTSAKMMFPFINAETMKKILPETKMDETLKRSILIEEAEIKGEKCTTITIPETWEVRSKLPEYLKNIKQNMVTECFALYQEMTR